MTDPDIRDKVQRDIDDDREAEKLRETLIDLYGQDAYDDATDWLAGIYVLGDYGITEWDASDPDVMHVVCEFTRGLLKIERGRK